jgi:AcrR family transcriptional regulator
MAPRPARDTYRHGAVREQAIAIARALVEAEGHGALSMRRVADGVGVAHRALYNHFADREALLDAVAEGAFADFAEALKSAVTPENYVRAYLTWSLANPHLRALMASRPHATMKHKPALQRAAHLAIAEALRIFGKPENTSTDNRRAVMKVLILLHGALQMHGSGILDVDGDEGLIAELQAMVRDA